MRIRTVIGYNGRLPAGKAGIWKFGGDDADMQC